MGVARLDDAEFARRARERNARVNAAHRQRLLEAGKAQTNVWLSAALRQRLDDEAAADGVSLSVVVERLLAAALNSATNTIEPDSTGSPPVDSAVDRDAHILALHSTGISLNQISGKLATMGVLTATGCPVSVSTINGVLKANGRKANGELKR